MTFKKLQQEVREICSMKRYFLDNIDLYREIVKFKSNYLEDNPLFFDVKEMYDGHTLSDENMLYMLYTLPTDMDVIRSNIFLDSDSKKKLIDANDTLRKTIDDFMKNSLKYFVKKASLRNKLTKEQFVDITPKCVVVGKITEGICHATIYTCEVDYYNGNRGVNVYSYTQMQNVDAIITDKRDWSDSMIKWQKKFMPELFV